MAFHSLEQICRLCREENKNFYQVILEDDMQEREASAEASHAKMSQLWQAMVQADRDYDPTLRSASGLSGCDGGRAAVFGLQLGVKGIFQQYLFGLQGGQSR